LSAGPQAGPDARLLRRASPDGGDQRVLLPHAHQQNARRLEGADAAALPVRRQGAPADHAHQAAAGRGRGGAVAARARDREGWADHLRSAPHLSPVFCYFTHETGPEAIAYARALTDLVRAAP